MSITAVSSQSVQVSQSDTSNLEASKQKIQAQIQQLQKEDQTKNAKEIQSLQQQLQDIETQIADQKTQSQKSSSVAASASKPPSAGPAYSVELSSKNAQATSKSLTEAATETSASETTEVVDISI